MDLVKYHFDSALGIGVGHANQHQQEQNDDSLEEPNFTLQIGIILFNSFDLFIVIDLVDSNIYVSFLGFCCVLLIDATLTWFIV